MGSEHRHRGYLRRGHPSAARRTPAARGRVHSIPGWGRDATRAVPREAGPSWEAAVPHPGPVRAARRWRSPRSTPARTPGRTPGRTRGGARPRPEADLAPCLGARDPPARREERREAAPSAAGEDAAAPLPRSSADDPRAVGLTLPSRARAPRSEEKQVMVSSSYALVRRAFGDSRTFREVRVIRKGALFRARARGRVRGVERPAAARPSWRPGRRRALPRATAGTRRARPWTS